jgi:hypothetical protein
MLEGFGIIARIERIEVIAAGRSIRTFPYWNRRFGHGLRREIFENNRVYLR